MKHIFVLLCLFLTFYAFVNAKENTNSNYYALDKSEYHTADMDTQKDLEYYDDDTDGLEIQVLDTPQVGAVLQVTSINLNIRQQPTTLGAVLVKLSQGQTVTFTGDIKQADGMIWWSVKTASNVNGFAASQFLTFANVAPPTTPPATSGPKVGTNLQVNNPTLNVRSQASTTATILTKLVQGNTVVATGEAIFAGGYTWWGVQGSFGKGYAASQYLKVVDGTVPPPSTSGSSKGERISQWALLQVGKRYTQAQCPATMQSNTCCRLGPNCFDCSGLIYTGYKMLGITVPAATMFYTRENMLVVDPANIKAGDILWRTGHVGLFIGDGKVVEAANTELGVIQSRFANWKYTTIYRPK